jgi:AmiR/NasT family two-component response regulator
MNPLSILIADDEELTLMDMREMLQDEGYIVCGEANSGKEAIELAKKLSPDLAILDVNMPEPDGIEVAKMLHSMNIPVLLLTAYSQPNYINRAEKVHVYGYVVKPFTERELLPAIKIAYARWKEMQQVRQELMETKTQLENQKIISRARNIIAAQQNITVQEAHQTLIQEAMRLRITLAEKARRVIKAAETTGE